MKKVFLVLLTLLVCNFSYAEDNLHNAIRNEDTIVYSLEDSSWKRFSGEEDGIIITKQLVEGTGSCSIYNNADGTLAFALATDYELINDGKLIIVDNNMLKYYKLLYNGESFEQVLLSEDEVKSIFPDVEIYKLSCVDSDGKMWLHKPLGKQRNLLLFNDTDRCFHSLNTLSKGVQDSEIKGLIKINKYGIIRFSHFGERDGKLVFYIR